MIQIDLVRLRLGKQNSNSVWKTECFSVDFQCHVVVAVMGSDSMLDQIVLDDTQIFTFTFEVDGFYRIVVSSQIDDATYKSLYINPFP